MTDQDGRAAMRGTTTPEPRGADGGGADAGEVAVIFASRRNGRDVAGYDAASAAMAKLAARQPGYRGSQSVRDAAGEGITISYWADDAAAIAWRDHPDHAAIRAAGRAHWYDAYRVTVCRVERAYRWSRSA